MDILESIKARMEQAVKEPSKQPKPGEDIRRADIPPKGGAWLIETPRKDYWGKGAHNIEIRNGFGLVEADWPEAVFLVHRLENDFKYKVTALDSRLADKMRLEFSRQQKPKPSGNEGLMKPGGL